MSPVVASPPIELPPAPSVRHRSARCPRSLRGAAQSRRALLIGGRRALIGGVARQPQRPQPRSLFPHRLQFGLILGHCLLGFTQLLLLLEQRSSATIRVIGIHAQYRNSLVRPKIRTTHVGLTKLVAEKFSTARVV